MSKKKKDKTGVRRAGEGSEISPFSRMTRLLEILVRLNLQTMRGDRTQKDMILMLDSVGCGPSEIAGLLGTTSNTVNVSLSTAKGKNRKK